MASSSHPINTTIITTLQTPCSLEFCPRFPRIAVCGFYQTQQLSSPLPTELSSATETVADADKNDSPPVIRSGGWSLFELSLDQEGSIQ